ncbi:MAG: YeeE/YedE thiosulfate transporter family protein [Candidatus Thermoplasmatota archaeon]|nr:YeeE/YedE thiosulfate transporter family protein [Candidatus Thermoplasmatota archaeon]
MSDETGKGEKGIFRELYDTLFEHSWEMWIGSIVLAMLSICLFMIASPWGSSGGLLNWGQNLFSSIGLSLEKSAPAGVTSLFEYKYALLSITMLIGALGSALLGKEFAIRVAPVGELFKGLFGGILMGIGCILAMGCTIGGFFSGWAALSGGALIFLLGLVIGVFVAVKYLLWEMENHPKMSAGKSGIFLQAKTKGTSLQPLAGFIVVIIGAAIALNLTDQVLIGFTLIGLFIGIILQRSRWCIVRALREPFLTGDSEPAVAIIAGLIIGLLGFTIIKIMGIGSEMTMVGSNFWMPAIVGGIIFGFGMTIAGGCTVGSTWRAGEGHVKLWLSLIGIIIAAPLTAEYIKPAFLNALSPGMKQQIFLPNHFTYLGSIIIMLLILLLWYIFAKWNERTGKLSAM